MLPMNRTSYRILVAGVFNWYRALVGAVVATACGGLLTSPSSVGVPDSSIDGGDMADSSAVEDGGVTDAADEEAMPAIAPEAGSFGPFACTAQAWEWHFNCQPTPGIGGCLYVVAAGGNPRNGWVAPYDAGIAPGCQAYVSAPQEPNGMPCQAAECYCNSQGVWTNVVPDADLECPSDTR